jgi:cell wall-associated NlpC family hydrolase
LFWTTVVVALLGSLTSGASEPRLIPPPIDPIAFEHIAPSPPPPSEVALHRALGMVGTPYAAGGADPSVGFDCTGLVHWAYAQSGTDLPRTSYGQWDLATPVDEPEPGDLVFFNTEGGISHVGINVDGKTFVHAVDFGKPVEVTSLEEPYWAATLLGYGRIGD